MIKHCKICGLEISDTDYDSWHRFISVKYCDDCRIAQRKKSQKEAKRRYEEKKKLERYREQWNGWQTVHLENEEVGEKTKELQTMQKQNQLLKEENKLLRESNAQLRAKNNPRTGGNQ